MLYSSSSIALALLEVLVHVKLHQIPDEYYWVKGKVPGDLTTDSTDKIPVGPADFGTDWLNSARAGVVLAVPSVIVPEKNYLLNPAHADFSRIEWAEPQKLVIDPRLVAALPAV